VVSRFSALAAAAGVGTMVATLADGGRGLELLFLVAALVVGLTIQHLIGQLRRRTRDVASVVRAVREVATAADVLAAHDAVCRAAASPSTARSVRAQPLRRSCR
jgi:hypothetical protein